jgi:hypothetical protein
MSKDTTINKKPTILSVPVKYVPERKQYETTGRGDYLKVIGFRTKKEAQNFCRKHGLVQANIIRYGTRFENIWAIGTSSRLTGVFGTLPSHTVGKYGIMYPNPEYQKL